jgi:glycosyltransferase involved in cell wall biosynthesis
VIYVCNDLGIPVFGEEGSSIHIRNLVRHFIELGYEPKVLYQNPGDADFEIPDKGLWRRIKQYPSQQSRVSQYLGISHLLKNTGLYATLSTMDDISLIHERYSLFSLAGLKFAQRRDIPFVLEVNSPLVHEKKISGTLQYPRLARRTERWLVSNATEVVVVSGELKRYYADIRNPSNITVVPNGVDPDKFDPRRFDEQTAEPTACRIGFLGSFKQWHGVMSLIEIAETLRDISDRVRFVMIGDGPLLDECVNTVKNRNLTGMFEFVGRVSHDSVAEELATLNVAIAPYPDVEFFYYSPIKVFEYLSMELPTIASDIGQISDVVDHGTNGFLVEPGELEGFSSTIRNVVDLYETEPDTINAMGKRGRSKVLSEYSWRANVKELEKVHRRAQNGY